MYVISWHLDLFVEFRAHLVNEPELNLCQQKVCRDRRLFLDLAQGACQDCLLNMP